MTELLDLRLAYCSETGARAHNEDALRVAQIGVYAHLIVSDGAGGHQRGEEASRRVVDHLDDALAAASMAGLSPQPEQVAQAIHAAHAALQAAQSEQHASRQMHATVVVLWLDLAARRAVWGHVGDSRLYRLRRGRVDLVTEDDSVVQRMVGAGLLSAEQARHHPHKNQLVAAMGMGGPVEAHTGESALLDGDVFLLCSDGWWDACDREWLEVSLARSPTAPSWLACMREHILGRHAQGQDNFSAIVAWIGQPDEITRILALPG